MEIEKLVQSTFNNHRESVVIIDMKTIGTQECEMGTGFIIRSTKTSCLVMTCCHLLIGFDASKHTLCIRFAGDATDYKAEILHEHMRADLAIIRVCGTKREYPALHFGDAKDVPAETIVCMLGYVFTGQTVHTLEPGVSPGKTCAPPQDVGSGFRDVSFTSAGKSGASGSPVMLGDKVIGVNFAQVVQVLYARSIEIVNDILKTWLGIADDVKKV